ncbi:MAG: hypothetical protein JW969_14220 [Spirochaetales bacterium]|nr:hypothetical protein [Spirochaetales bacterium]
MKKILGLAVVIVVGLIAMGCVSGPSNTGPTPLKTPEPPPPTPRILEHKTSDFGGSVPDWVSKTPIQMEKEDEYSTFYVFIEDHPGGKDLEGLKLWAKNFDAKSTIADMVSQRVQSKFVGAAAGDKDMLETYMEQVVKSVSNAEFSGMRVNDEFWVLKQYFNGDGTVDREEYRYLFLITVPRKAINDAIARALNGVKPKTEEEKTAVDRVKEAFGEGMD